VIDPFDVIQFLHNPLSYEQKLVSLINKKGEQIPLLSFSELYNDQEATVKIEGMEKFNLTLFNKCEEYKALHNHVGPVTCHLFMARSNSPSFKEHTDPDDVIIYCVEGKKTLTVNGENVILREGEEVFIPANTPHKASNEFAALTLSFGLEKFLSDKAKDYELDTLFKNNGDVQS
jgi:mannose-6-phosphate isomerase-like protein (cupin superfamily)